MFHIGDYVISPSNGICRITDIVEMDMTGGKNSKSYFLLKPINEAHAKVYIPTKTAGQRLRKAMGQTQAMQMIKSIRGIAPLTVDNERERERKYKDAIQSGDPVLLVSVIKNIYVRKQERCLQGKKATAVDEKYFKIAVRNLQTELAYALDCTEESVGSIIREHLNKTTDN